MAECDTNTDKSPKGPLVRSSKEIKANLLSGVWMTAAAAGIISEIQVRSKRNATMPEGHKEALQNIVPGQDHAISLQNLRNFVNDVPARFSDAATPESEKAASVSFITDLGDYKNTETCKIAHEALETERLWLQENIGRPERLLELLSQLEEEEPEDNNVPPEPRKSPHLQLV